jgi:phosphate:Na+ symporter
MLTIAFAHAFQNTVMTFIMFFFIKQMIFLAKFFVKDKFEKQIPEEMFDEKLIHESPSLALEFVKKAILIYGFYC